MSTPLIIRPAEGLTIPLGPSHLTIKLTSAQTGGRLALLEYRVAPSFVPPTTPHGHTRESQTVYIIEGSIRFEFEDQTVDLEAGSSLYIPENCLFNWQNPRPSPARMLYVFAPAGFEQFFVDVQQIYAKNPGVPPADISPLVKGLWAEYGIVSS